MLTSYITGATGLLGQSFLNSKPGFLSNHNVLGLSRSTQTDRIKLTNYSTEDALRFASIGNVGYIIHCSGAPSIFSSLRNPILDKENNLDSFFFSLELARNTNATLIFFSSNEVYGDIAPDLRVENATCEPTNFYGLSKLTCEKYLQLYHEHYGVPFQIFRPTVFYAERELKRNLLFDLTKSFADKTKNNIDIFCTLDSVFDFIHVNDIVSATNHIISSGKELNEIWNIGSGTSFSAQQLIRWFSDNSQSNKEVIIKEKNYNQKYLNTDKINRSGWQAKQNLLENLATLVENYGN